MKTMVLAGPVAVLLGGLALTFASAFTGPATSGDLNFRINGMNNSKGVVRVVLYNSEKTFLSEHQFAIADSAYARANGAIDVTLHHVPFGEYAAAVYQDENRNGVIDQNLLRIPTEPYAFSNGIRAKWAVPDFKDVAFQFKEPGEKIAVTLRDWSDQ